MKTIILSCTSLLEFVEAAQKSQGTSYPVISVDRSFHTEPENMKAHIAGILKGLPEEVDTVLVAMAFCGGVWDHVTAPRRLVIPRFDDCVSILLHTGDDYCPNRKELGHLYLFENDPDTFSALTIPRGEGLGDEFKGLDPDFLHHMLFDNYKNMDIIDTGLNDCYSEDYVIKAQAYADEIEADLGYAEGGIGLLEKLVFGRWDDQFIVAEKGQLIRHGDFF